MFFTLDDFIYKSSTICITTADNFLQLSFPGFLPYSKVSNKLAFSLLKLQHAKKVVFHSPGLVDFAIGLVNSVFNLPDGLVMFFEESEKQKNFEINSASQKGFGAS